MREFPLTSVRFSGSQGNIAESAEGTKGRGEGSIKLNSAPLGILSDLGELTYLATARTDPSKHSHY
jgi:hypothetical protein